MNKYELNYIQWITGLPRNIAKTVTDLKAKDDGRITFKAKFSVNANDWRMGCGSSK